MTHILIVNSPYYADISSMLVDGTTNALKAAGASFEILDVPGAFEIPAAIRFAMNNKKYDGFVALGCVIRGETTHYDYVCEQSARGLMDLSLQQGAAIGFGILTVENEEQAVVRADPKQGNKGKDAVVACLRMVELKRQFDVTT